MDAVDVVWTKVSDVRIAGNFQDDGFEPLAAANILNLLTNLILSWRGLGEGLSARNEHSKALIGIVDNFIINYFPVEYET